MKHTVKKVGIIRPEKTKSGKADQPPATVKSNFGNSRTRGKVAAPTPSVTGGTRKGKVGNPKDCGY